ncbi:MAG: methyl-accepting chemotaxis protein [Sulfuricurvum sp.]|nr:methyl-accepting chemotaxis protein [Sulfuricurvum sp.]
MKWLDNMVLQSKLILLTTVMLIALVALGFLGYSTTVKWNDSVTQIGKVNVPSILGLMKMRTGLGDVVLQVARVNGFEPGPKAQEKLKGVLKQIDEGFALYKEGYDIYASLAQTPEAASIWKKYEEDYKNWKDIQVEFRTQIVEPYSNTGDMKLQSEYSAKVQPYIDRMRLHRQAMIDGINKVTDINEAGAKQAVTDAEKESSGVLKLTIGMVSFALFVAILLAVMIIRSITRAVTGSVTLIRDGAMQITSASEQVASSSSSLAQGASQQASSVEEVSATLEESTAINTQNVDNARQADILAKNANDSARAGYEKGEKLSTSMHAITESAAKISGIIKAIDQIAFQTNLLALNAAVEAARAGEHGLGFAVVADEVRNLAQRAAGAAKETSDIIEEVVGQIKEGNAIAHATHTSFSDIVEQTKKVSDLIGEISIAGKEQSEGMNQISQAMGQVDQVTQQVAANSEEAAAAAEELSAQATTMIESIEVLAKMVGMSANAPISAQRSFNAQPPRMTPAPQQQRTVAPTRRPAALSQARSSAANDVFPLHEDDLKEF